MPHRRDHIRVMFLGHSCGAAAAALAAMLPTADTASPRRQPNIIEIGRVILAGSPQEPPGVVERLAETAGIPVVWVASSAEATAELRADAPDVAVAACFPWRLPRAARDVPPFGMLNVHPSLLPIGRGPEPVFWTLRRGERTSGVTVHQMDAGLDTGPIVAQETLALPGDVCATKLEEALMARGGRLLRDALPALVSGELRPAPQRLEGATYAPVPAPADWAMVTSLPAAWAWRFARGVAPLGGPLTVLAGGRAIRVSDAVDWSPEERLSEAVIEEGDSVIRVRFSPGWVRFRRADAQS